MSFIFFGDPEKPKKRTKHTFQTIEKSVYMEQLNSLPNFPSSASLRQDAIFAAVSSEFKQVKDDVIAIYNKLNDELQIEKVQTGETNRTISDSMKKLESSLCKLRRLRSKQKKSYTKQYEKFESAYLELDRGLRDVKNMNLELVETLAERQIEYVDESKFPLIAKLVNKKLKKNVPDDSTRNGTSTSFPPRSSVPPQLTIPTIRGASSPSVSVTLENINISESFCKRDNFVKDIDLLNQ